MVPVSAQSFERTTHNEATDSVSLTAGAQRREYKRPYALGEVPVKVLSDGGSTPPISTNLIAGRTPEQFDERSDSSTNLIAGRTPEVTIVVLPYGFVLAAQIKDRL